MLTTAEGIRVVGEGNTRERAVAVVSEARPGVVLLDLRMPGGAGETTIRKMLALPQPPGIVTMYGEPHVIRRLIGVGASAYLAKGTGLEEPLDTVRGAAATPHSPPGKARVAPQDAP
jgi:DNA-binding NarL/FixJ family response regulator